MKPTAILILTALLAATLLRAEKADSYVPAITLQVGTDIGGAVPGMKFIPSVFKPYPEMKLSLGGRVEMPLSKHTSLNLDCTYKTVTMGADAYVENQLAFVPDNTTETGYMKQYYTGQAYMNMSFTMLEFPVYLSIHLGKTQRNHLLVGGYGAWVMNTRFKTDPFKGYIGDYPNQVSAVVEEASDDVSMDFGNVMSHWDAGLCVGYEYHVLDRVRIGFRFMAGMKDIFLGDVFPENPEVKKVLEYRMTHMRGALCISYDLFNHKGWWVNH